MKICKLTTLAALCLLVAPALAWAQHVPGSPVPYGYRYNSDPQFRAQQEQMRQESERLKRQYENDRRAAEQRQFQAQQEQFRLQQQRERQAFELERERLRLQQQQRNQYYGGGYSNPTPSWNRWNQPQNGGYGNPSWGGYGNNQYQQAYNEGRQEGYQACWQAFRGGQQPTPTGHPAYLEGFQVGCQRASNEYTRRQQYGGGYGYGNSPRRDRDRTGEVIIGGILGIMREAIEMCRQNPIACQKN
ncbi:MAG: hypothetical protein EBR79_00945 [Proteobacteria bacterium]|nr:hypothetical protein [Pseudomonadota bacterium]